MAGDNVPQTRKDMINLMYLVLTALLALNVTREVLNAFSTMNNSIVRSNQSISRKNAEIYGMLKDEMATPDSNKTRKWYEKSLEIKKRTGDLVDYLDSWKDSMITLSGGYVLSHGDSVLKGMDNIYIPTNYFINKKYGNQLQAHMQKYVKYALSLVDSAPVQERMETQFPLQVSNSLPKTEDNPTGDWSYGTFHNIPVVASVAMLSKFQNDVKNSEAMLLEYFRKQVHAQDLKFNALKALAVPNTTYALEGQKIDATIMLAAYNKNARGLSSTSSRGNVKFENGVGHIEFKASGIGQKTVHGTITLKNGSKIKTRDWDFKYIVGTAGASLQLDKMNVMYIGVPNPVTLSASGYNIEDVSLRWQGKGISQKSTGKGTYNVKVTQPGNVTYKIVAKKHEGGTVQVGGGKMRIKRIPDPVAEVAGKSQGLVKTGLAKAQLGVLADLKNFVYDARFVVQSFNFTWVPKNRQAKSSPNEGARWSKTVQEYINRSHPGDKWVIDDVRAKGPAGHTRKINPIVITLN